MIKSTIKPKRKQLLLADPNVISPDTSPDGKWHLFCHSSAGIQHYFSSDGEKWSAEKHTIVSSIGNDKSRFLLGNYGATPISLIRVAIQGLKTKTGTINTYLRAFVFKEDSVFYMFYEKRWFAYKGNKVAVPDSEIYLIKSKDLYSWSEPKSILKSTAEHQLVSSPSLVKDGNTYKLFFTHGYILTGDSSLMEPAYLSSVTSSKIDGQYGDFKNYTIADNENNRIENVGALRCKSIEGKMIVTCNTFNKKTAKSVSELYFAEISGTQVKLISPVVSKDEWFQSKIANSYVADLVKLNGKVRVYFNVRKTMRLFDGYKVDKTMFGAALLVVQNFLFSTEQIYYKDFELTEILKLGNSQQAD